MMKKRRKRISFVFFYRINKFNKETPKSDSSAKT